MHLHKDKAVALYVSYFWLYFSLSTQLVCMSGRVQLIAFLEYKQGLKHFFSSYAEMKKNTYYINLELQEQTTWLAESFKRIVKFLASKS